ncbi:MAG: 2Fe-2S iron-sulfur cluster-binding protein [Paenibacillus dendritiformis]|uniref:2Fe-2S iron-sulfur cluster-binding protein n=1 Tax=Paenibacillus dendritiformis TaxID=130049 RepID=UPI00143DFCF6|nr:2Fe-2S iron-sulfur cluster-binding protein [Paenibacillus dendritiformis]MDU5140559.1 2Fe-2S iron-sulfur cluster-binding protein [Paenibacillus dendritiformis]NKI23318.1 (2Fe-2S)-binding protein [Paenibacillus dendritiformis]NRF98376.1 (2Fe-2S)-binding protein [Paenibacillus dendritiformis]GIO70867.1 hypothetical protein J27TS7_03810 [Paenibacillus dendritiformis]
MAEIKLRGREREAAVTVQVGTTLLEAAIQAKVDWSYSCTRGTCARCRCRIVSGYDNLGDVTDAEWNRMEEDEFHQGYRLACQTTVVKDGQVEVIHKPYFG